MEKLVVHGGGKLNGKVKVSGAKNAVLPIIAATLLAEDAPCILEEVPNLNDVRTISEVLKALGAEVSFDIEKKYPNCG